MAVYTHLLILCYGVSVSVGNVWCPPQLLDVTDRMARCAAATRTKAHSVFLKRYGEILCDHTTEYRSIKASIAKKRDTAKLFKEIQCVPRRGCIGGRLRPCG